MKDGEWYAFWQSDLNNVFFERWKGAEGSFHGGFFFGRGTAKIPKGKLK